MTEPKIADRKPCAQQLEPGKQYYFCACGESSNQPFCDGSHRGTEFSPVPFSVEEGKTCHLCMCKRTGNAPFCDGAHKSLPPE
ncbi:CDGSH iron-sulfur domain-containing protein [Candidatus Sumerlaeota bacterium]|nr:CDGSH iron-sulfur domain-containing protein [Candidatus Sumerlaeota bacterium]